MEHTVCWQNNIYKKFRPVQLVIIKMIEGQINIMYMKIYK